MALLSSAFNSSVVTRTAWTPTSAVSTGGGGNSAAVATTERLILELWRLPPPFVGEPMLPPRLPRRVGECPTPGPDGEKGASPSAPLLGAIEVRRLRFVSESRR